MYYKTDQHHSVEHLYNCLTLVFLYIEFNRPPPFISFGLGPLIVRTVTFTTSYIYY